MDSLKSHLLVATPQLQESIFAQSVILMLDHSAEGAMGVILNRALGTTITNLSGKILDEDFEWDKPLHLGGPVNGPLLVVHAIPEMGDQEVIPNVYYTLEATKVQEIISRKAEPSLVIANYSGWGPGQLEGEIEEDSWVTLPAVTEYVFWNGTNELWKVVFQAIQSRKLTELLRLREVPPDPTVN